MTYINAVVQEAWAGKVLVSRLGPYIIKYFSKTLIKLPQIMSLKVR